MVANIVTTGCGNAKTEGSPDTARLEGYAIVSTIRKRASPRIIRA